MAHAWHVVLPGLVVKKPGSHGAHCVSVLLVHWAVCRVPAGHTVQAKHSGA